MKRLAFAVLAPLCVQAQTTGWEWSLFTDRIQPKASIQNYSPEGTLEWYAHRTTGLLHGGGLRLARTGALVGPFQWAATATYRPATFSAIESKFPDGSVITETGWDPGMYGYGYLGLGAEARIQAGADWTFGLEWREESSAFKVNAQRFSLNAPVGTADYREQFRHGRAWARVGARLEAPSLPMAPFIALEAAWALRPIGYDTTTEAIVTMNSLTRMAPMHQLALHVGIRL